MSRRGLTRTRIVATAVEMADDEGLEAVTLRGLASRLGVHVTSLYNHVPTKEAVLDGMVAALIAEAKLPTGAVTWEEWVRRFAEAIRTVAHKHPGAFAAFHYRPVQGPQALESTETALAAFTNAGFSVTEAYAAVRSTGLAVLGLLLDDAARLRAPTLDIDLRVLSPERFPHVREASAIAAEADPWSYLIDVLVKGFAANLRKSKARRRRGRATRRRTR